MKTQQRSFVVEFKSGRRRSGAQPDSIWGNTDLKALVRQAESEAPHLFDAEPSPEALAHDDNTQLDEGAGPQPDETQQTRDDVPAKVSLTEPLQGHPLRDHAEAVAQVSSTKRRPTNRIPKTAKRVGSARLEGPAFAAGDGHSSAAQVEGPDELDGLEGLEAENRRLKALLAHQFRQENIKLKKMLERFSAP